jgi:cation transport protein ChaC
MAFRILEHQWDATLSYLRSREQVTKVYLERRASVKLLKSGVIATALTYVVDRHHQQYAGRLTQDKLVEHVQIGQGLSGHNVDYIRNTVSHLSQMGIRDVALEHLLEAIDAQANARAN